MQRRHIRKATRALEEQQKTAVAAQCRDEADSPDCWAVALWPRLMFSSIQKGLGPTLRLLKLAGSHYPAEGVPEYPGLGRSIH